MTSKGSPHTGRFPFGLALPFDGAGRPGEWQLRREIRLQRWSHDILELRALHFMDVSPDPGTHIMVFFATQKGIHHSEKPHIMKYI